MGSRTAEAAGLRLRRVPPRSPSPRSNAALTKRMKRSASSAASGSGDRRKAARSRFFSEPVNCRRHSCSNAASPALAAGATADARGIFGSTIVPSTLTKSAKAKPAHARCVCAGSGVKQGEAGGRAWRGCKRAHARRRRKQSRCTHRPGRCARRWRATRRAARGEGRSGRDHGEAAGATRAERRALCQQRRRFEQVKGGDKALRARRARPTRAGARFSRTCIAVGAWPRLRTAAQNSAVVSRPS